jgi:putative ABC transport system permease protein
MIAENILLALSSLRANKMRALLTMLGIIIGITSVIAIVTIGNAMTTSVTDNFSQFGTSNISVYVQQKSQSGFMGGNMVIMGPGGPPGGMAMGARGRQQQTPTDADLISTDMISELKTAYPEDILGVSYSYSGGSATVKDKELYANISITGVNEDYFLANTTTLLDGRFVTEDDIEKNRTVAVISDKLAQKIFAGKDPLGEQIKVFKTNKIELYTVIGVYEYEQTGFGSLESEENLTTGLYIPISTAKRDVLQENYQQITVVAGADTDVIQFTQNITGYFDEVYSNNETWSVTAMSMEEQLESIQAALGTISLAVAFIAAISLVVGGIGVMNIMLVSVTERTREIGTRKALGAKNFHIQLQVVVEAVIISGGGGVIGVILGTAVGVAVSLLMQAPVSISLLTVIVSVLFSMSIGIFFGLYPANKAAKLDPIEALRYE